MQIPQISVLLPFTTEGELVREAIDSILQQSFTDFEVLLLDNGSDEETRRGVCEYTDPRIVHLTEERPGISFALNTGLARARGEFIARMDADDIAHRERLQKQLLFLESHPEIGAVGCATSLFPATEINEGYRLFVEWQNQLLTPEQHHINRFVESPVAHPSIMFRKKLIDRYGNYSTEKLPEDYELWLRWMDNGVPIAKLEEKLLYWRDRPARLSRTDENYNERAFFEVKARYIKSFLDQQPALPEKIIVCGGSRNNTWKINKLENFGITVHAVTDVVQRNTDPRPFIPAQELQAVENSLIINLIAKRDVRESIRTYLQSLGFTEGSNFIMAG